MTLPIKDMIIRWLSAKRIAFLAVVSGLIAVPGYHLYDWASRTVLYTKFRAACNDNGILTTYDIDNLHFVEGEYSGEFWREVIARFTDDVLWDGETENYRIEDGKLYVTWSYNTPVTPPTGKYDGEPEEDAFYVTTDIAYHLLERRIAEGADIAPFRNPDLLKKLQFGYPRADMLFADTCGYLELLILRDGILAKP